MALKVTRVDTWAVTIEDRPGRLAAKLRALADAKANLEFVGRPSASGGGEAMANEVRGIRRLAGNYASGLRRARSEVYAFVNKNETRDS